MIDYSLKFVEEAQAQPVLFTEDGPVYPNTDVIGPIEGVAGWHANVRSEAELPELEQYRLYPANPVRVWASGADAPLPSQEADAPVEPIP